MVDIFTQKPGSCVDDCDTIDNNDDNSSCAVVQNASTTPLGSDQVVEINSHGVFSFVCEFCELKILVF